MRHGGIDLPPAREALQAEKRFSGKGGRETDEG